MNSAGVDLRVRGSCESSIISCLSTCSICVEKVATHTADDRRYPGRFFKIKLCVYCLNGSFKNVSEIEKSKKDEIYAMLGGKNG